MTLATYNRASEARPTRADKLHVAGPRNPTVHAGSEAPNLQFCKSAWAETQVHACSSYHCGRCGESLPSPHDVYRHLESCDPPAEPEPPSMPARVRILPEPGDRDAPPIVAWGRSPTGLTPLTGDQAEKWTGEPHYLPPIISLDASSGGDLNAWHAFAAEMRPERRPKSASKARSDRRRAARSAERRRRATRTRTVRRCKCGCGNKIPADADPRRKFIDGHRDAYHNAKRGQPTAADNLHVETPEKPHGKADSQGRKTSSANQGKGAI